MTDECLLDRLWDSFPANAIRSHTIWPVISGPNDYSCYLRLVFAWHRQGICPPRRLAANTVLISNDTTETPSFPNPKLAEQTRWYIFLEPEPLSGKELCTFYCDPTLLAPKILVAPSSTTGTAFSVEFIQGQRNAPYGSLDRLYSVGAVLHTHPYPATEFKIYTNSSGTAQYLTIQDDGRVPLQPAILASTPQLFVLTLEPFGAGRNITANAKLGQGFLKRQHF
ncbi:hypothetical protein DFH09DRAFT_1317067 [Mycena vulgaris]|nr:hypothetical protein DFH09DRAFT_1317067 [Mycena vulgaris]